MALSPKDSAELISKLSVQVKIREDGIRTLGNTIVEEINSGRLCIENFSQNEYHPKAEDPWALDWIFVVDTLNFCFWHFEDKNGWEVEGKTGYFALCTAVNRAMRENVDILNPKFYSTITKEQVLEIFRGDADVPIPLISDRAKCLREVGSCLLEKFDGSFLNCVKQCNNSALQLLKIIVQNFECFQDEAIYRKHDVSFYKRAQILISDIWTCFKNQGIGYFKDIDEITMFADYRVPQSLLFFNVLEYSTILLNILNTQCILPSGCEVELEIRGCSIKAVFLIVEYVKKRLMPGKSVNSILIDHFLWDYRRSHAKEFLKKEIPFHKSYSIYY